MAAPLTASESAAYLLGRLALASSHPGQPSPFSPEALASLHYHAAGLPRRLNRLADLAMLIGYAQALPLVDASTIAVAAREFDQDGLAA